MTFLDMRSLETPRLILRRITKKDASDMFEYSRNPEVSKYLTWSAHEDRAYTASYIKFLIKKYRSGEYFDWGIEIKDSGKFIGTCGFSVFDATNKKAELGYVLNPLFQGFGYAEEAVKAVIDYSFGTLELHRLEARVMEGNLSSEKLLKKCGFNFEGTGIHELFVKEEYKTIHHYALVNNR